jgi:hypothetical protein
MSDAERITFPTTLECASLAQAEVALKLLQALGLKQQSCRISLLLTAEMRPVDSLQDIGARELTSNP